MAPDLARDGVATARVTDPARAAIPSRPEGMDDVRSNGVIDRGTGGLVVAIDGPAASGKSSVGAAAALELGYRFCDTGLLYRATAWLAMARGIEPDQVAAVVRLVDEVELAPDAVGRLDRVLVDGLDVTDAVHSVEVDDRVSAYARVSELRAALVPRQRALAEDGRLIMAGRDIGTVILPNADLKIFLDASVEERARRRVEERGLVPSSVEADQILEQLRRRDEIDRQRPVAPLRPADDAVILRTDGNRFEDTVRAVVDVIVDREALVAASRAR